MGGDKYGKGVNKITRFSSWKVATQIPPLKSVLFSLKHRFVLFSGPPSTLPGHISILYSAVAGVRNGINLHWSPSSSPNHWPQALSREQAGARITAWQPTPPMSATTRGGDPTPRPLGELRGQRDKAKTGGKVYFSRLRGAGLRYSRSSFVALLQIWGGILRSTKVFVISRPSWLTSGIACGKYSPYF